MLMSIHMATNYSRTSDKGFSNKIEDAIYLKRHPPGHKCLRFYILNPTPQSKKGQPLYKRQNVRTQSVTGEGGREGGRGEGGREGREGGEKEGGGREGGEREG